MMAQASRDELSHEPCMRPSNPLLGLPGPSACSDALASRARLVTLSASHCFLICEPWSHPGFRFVLVSVVSLPS